MDLTFAMNHLIMKKIINFGKTKSKREKERKSFVIEFARYVDDKWNDSIVTKFSYKVIAGIAYMDYQDHSCCQSPSIS